MIETKKRRWPRRKKVTREKKKIPELKTKRKTSKDSGQAKTWTRNRRMKNESPFRHREKRE